MLERCEFGKVFGFTGAHLVLEVTHRLMMLEAVGEGLVSPGGVAKKLRGKPGIVRKLYRYQQQVEAIPEMGIEIFPIDMGLVEESFRYRRDHGLLVNDSITLALAARLGVEGIATADADLLRLSRKVPFRFYSPGDLD